MQIKPNMFVPRISASNQVMPVVNQTDSSDFRQIMESAYAQKELHFSKHANLRLETRNIKLAETQINRVKEGVALAQQKGIRDSLVLVDNIALVVNITNKVVVTALNQHEQANGDNVFTNIDGAVIV